jgi:DNA-binding NarL/FixJ family response regulator
MPTVEEIRVRINSEKNYVHIKRFNYDIENVLDRYPEGAPNKVIAAGLQMTEEEVEETWQRIVLKLREAMKVEV